MIADESITRSLSKNLCICRASSISIFAKSAERVDVLSVLCHFLYSWSLFRNIYTISIHSCSRKICQKAWIFLYKLMCHYLCVLLIYLRKPYNEHIEAFLKEQVIFLNSNSAKLKGISWLTFWSYHWLILSLERQGQTTKIWVSFLLIHKHILNMFYLCWLRILISHCSLQLSSNIYLSRLSFFHGRVALLFYISIYIWYNATQIYIAVTDLKLPTGARIISFMLPILSSSIMITRPHIQLEILGSG